MGFKKLIIEEPHFSLLSRQKLLDKINYSFLEQSFKKCQENDIQAVFNCDIILHDPILKDIQSFISRLVDRGYTVIRVQDLGLANYIFNNFPHLKLEINTATGNYNNKSYQFLEHSFSPALNCILFSKEIPYIDLNIIQEKSQLNNELLVHGPILMFYTKRRLIKESPLDNIEIDGEDRFTLLLKEQKRPDEWFEFYDNHHGAFMFYCHELALLEVMDKVLDSNIPSLLFDFRSKSNDVKKAVSHLYFEKINELRNNSKDKLNLKSIEHFYPHGFSTGFFLENSTDSHTKSKEEIEYRILGKIISIVKEKTIAIEVFETINLNDELKILTPAGKELQYNPKSFKLLSNESIETAMEGQIIIAEWRKGIVPESYIVIDKLYL